MDFKKRRETSSIAHWRISRSWTALPHFFLNNRTAQRNPYERPGLTSHGSMETARSAAGRRKDRWFRKHEQLSFLLPSLHMCHLFGIRSLVSWTWTLEQRSSEACPWQPRTLFYRATKRQRSMPLATLDCVWLRIKVVVLPVAFHSLNGFTNGITYKNNWYNGQPLYRVLGPLIALHISEQLQLNNRKKNQFFNCAVAFCIIQNLRSTHTS
jgi:hypothetical protein